MTENLRGRELLCAWLLAMLVLSPFFLEARPQKRLSQKKIKSSRTRTVAKTQREPSVQPKTAYEIDSLLREARLALAYGLATKARTLFYRAKRKQPSLSEPTWLKPALTWQPVPKPQDREKLLSLVERNPYLKEGEAYERYLKANPSDQEVRQAAFHIALNAGNAQALRHHTSFLPSQPQLPKKSPYLFLVWLLFICLGSEILFRLYNYFYGRKEKNVKTW